MRWSWLLALRVATANSGISVASSNITSNGAATAAATGAASGEALGGMNVVAPNRQTTAAVDLETVAAWSVQDSSSVFIQTVHALNPADYGGNDNCTKEPYASFREQLGLSNSYTDDDIKNAVKLAMATKLAAKGLNSTGVSKWSASKASEYGQKILRYVSEKYFSSNDQSESSDEREGNVILGGEGLDLDWTEYLNTLSQDVLKKIIQGTSGTSGDGGTDGKIMQAFVDSVMFEGVLDSVVDKVIISVGTETTFKMTSTMENLGAGLCHAAAESLTDEEKEAYVCAVVGALRGFISCNTEFPEYRSENMPSLRDQYLACNEYDQDPNAGFRLSVNITEEDNAEQGNIDRWLYNGLDMFYLYSRYRFNTTSAKNMVFVPGWTTVGEAVLDYSKTEDAAIRSRMPVALILYQTSCQFLVLIRGTALPIDWLIDFHYTLNIQNVHSGFATISAPIISALQQSIAAFGCAKSRISLTGHSMGAGTALVTAYNLTRQQYDDVRVVAFAPPNALGLIAADYLVARAKAVRLNVNELDAVSEIPCSLKKTGLPVCDGSGRRDVYSRLEEKRFVMENGKLMLLMPTLYNNVISEFNLDLNSFSYSADLFDTPTPLKMAQLHSCSFNCWFDTAYCHDEARARNICAQCEYY